MCGGCRRTVPSAPLRCGRPRVTEGCEVEPGAGEETADEAGTVLHPFEPGLDQRGELAEVVLGEVGQRPLEVRPDRFDRVEFVGLRQEPADRQPLPRGNQLGHPRFPESVDTLCGPAPPGP
jgi:hypothetical protein